MSNFKLFSIPNLVTCANLACGYAGIVFVFQGNFAFACYSIYLAAIFDFIDGFVSRLFNASSELGKQLDSLCDMISFGLLPGFIFYHLLVEFKWAAVIVPLFSALRLAKFNLDQRQSDSFIGMPTPMNALFVTSLAFIFQNKVIVQEINFLLLFLVLFSSIMLVVELPLLSLKFKNYRFKENIYRYIILFITLILGVIFKWDSFAIVYFVYILLSIINNSRKKYLHEIHS